MPVAELTDVEGLLAEAASLDIRVSVKIDESNARQLANLIDVKYAAQKPVTRTQPMMSDDLGQESSDYETHGVKSLHFFTLVSREVRQDRTLKAVDKNIVLAIAEWLTHKHSTCFGSFERIAEVAGSSQSTVSRRMPELVKRGYLKQASRGNHPDYGKRHPNAYSLGIRFGNDQEPDNKIGLDKNNRPVDEYRPWDDQEEA